MPSLHLFCRMMADDIRLRVLRMLTESDACVCELSDALDLPQSTLSNHLAKLRAAGMVRIRRDGAWVYYGIAPKWSKTVSEAFHLFGKDDQLRQQVKQDKARFRKRLAMRIGGKCYHSYGQLNARSLK